LLAASFALRNYENGMRVPTWPSLAKIIQVLNVGVVDIENALAK